VLTKRRTKIVGILKGLEKFDYAWMLQFCEHGFFGEGSLSFAHSDKLALRHHFGGVVLARLLVSHLKHLKHE
jgi:hypothetical protein